MINEVKLLAANLSVGDTLRTVCPQCEGGNTREASFSITKDEDGVVYTCFRAKCGFKGAHGAKTRKLVHTTDLYFASVRKAARAMDIWVRAAEASQKHRAWISEKFQYPVWETLGYRVDPLTGRTLVPLFSRGKLHAFVARRFYPHNSPKAITYRLDPTTPALGFWGGHEPSSLLVVEDVFSAGAMHHLGCNTCALLGTDTSEAGWMDISAFASRNTKGKITLILDEDATTVAIGHCLRRRNMFVDINIYPLSGLDIKDRDPEWRNNLKREVE